MDLKQENANVSSISDTPSHHSATEPHDYIYGVRLLYKEFLGGITVDYNRDVSAIFAEAASSILNHGGWRLLSLARHENKRIGCPSWSPDWSSNHIMSWFLPEIENTPKAALEALPRNDQISFSRDRKMLSTPDIVLARVMASSPEHTALYPGCENCAKYCCAPHLWDRVARWIKLCGLLCSEDINHYHPTLSLGSIMCTAPQCGPIHPSRFRVFEEALEDVCLNGARTHSYTHLEYADVAITDWLNWRHLVLTEEGAMGATLHGRGVESGDIIVKFDPLPQTFALGVSRAMVSQRMNFLGGCNS
jgi:hypothetical protein